MGLFEHFFKNDHLRFLDAATSEKYLLPDLLHDIPIAVRDQEKLLVFLYLDDTIHSLSVYLSFLNSNHTLALLNAELGDGFKKELETLYTPTLIFDPNRSSIHGFSVIQVSAQLGNYDLFHNPDNLGNIHSKCKLLLSTSGSTGSPKFVKLSEDNLLQNALSIAAYLPINSKDITPLNLPINYSYGLSVLHSNALAGGTIVCGMGDIIQRAFWTDCIKYGFTSIAGVPFIYEMLDRIGFRKKEYPTLRYLTQAGGNLNTRTKEKFAEYCSENQIEFFIMYGQTEATARISYVPPHKLKEKINSIGIPIKNGALSIDPDNDELLYSGPNVFGGYATQKSDLSLMEEGHELRTGDIAKKDDEGYYYITGRMKRFVKLYGNRINLDELERYLKNTFGNTALATNGIEDKILLISYSGDTLDEGGIKKVIFAHFKIHPSSVKFHHIEEIPLTSNGKVNYKKLLADYDI